MNRNIGQNTDETTTVIAFEEWKAKPVQHQIKTENSMFLPKVSEGSEMARLNKQQ